MSGTGELAPGTLTALIEDLVRSGAEAADAWAEGLIAGTVLGRYELIREVGRGGFGVVWEARDRDLGRVVALKALRAPGDAARERRLLAEAEVAARLSHPNIVTILDVSRCDRGVYLVQEFLSGQALSRRLDGPRQALPEALRIAEELARGLAHAHAHGVVHRDLTPSNVQLCEDGQVKITDLGMASALGRRKLDGGTPDYMAPEQARGEPEDERTDVFALGAILFRMLTGASSLAGRAPGKARTPRGLAVPEAPGLAELVEAMLAAEPRDRPRDAGEVLRELRSIRASLPRLRPDRPSRARVRPPPRNRWMAMGAAGALATAAACGVAVFAWGGWPFPKPGVLVLAGSSASTGCTWSLVARHWFGALPEGAVARNGAFQGQEAASRDGRGVWLQRSDWNQLFVRLPELESSVFAVQVDFHAPRPDGSPREAKLMVFTDPGGPDASDVRHGRGVSLLDEPGRSPGFEWGRLDGMTARVIAYRGTLAEGFADRWRTIRIEGSRANCWLRVLLDGVPLLTSVGECDLAGSHVLLASNGGTYRPADVAWRDLRVFRGGDECR